MQQPLVDAGAVEVVAARQAADEVAGRVAAQADAALAPGRQQRAAGAHLPRPEPRHGRLGQLARLRRRPRATETERDTRLTALCPGLPGWAGTRKVKPIWTLLQQETVSGSGISWAVWKSAPRPRQITTPAPQQSVFYRPDALPAAQPTTASKH